MTTHSSVLAWRLPRTEESRQSGTAVQLTLGLSHLVPLSQGARSASSRYVTMTADSQDGWAALERPAVPPGAVSCPGQGSEGIRTW